jgi:hypothetical protein
VDVSRGGIERFVSAAGPAEGCVAELLLARALLLFSQPSTAWLRPTHIVEGHLLCPECTDVTVKLIHKTPAQKHPE